MSNERENDVPVSNKKKKRKRESPSESLIESLSEGCKENILDVRYLLGVRGSGRYAGEDAADHLLRDPVHALKRLLWSRPRRRHRKRKRKESKRLSPPPVSSLLSGDGGVPKVYLELHSAKMRGLKDLLCAEKLNTSAIQLQLTAQSQTIKGRGGGKDHHGDGVGGADAVGEELTASGRPKRSRRE